MIQHKASISHSKTIGETDICIVKCTSDILFSGKDNYTVLCEEKSIRQNNFIKVLLLGYQFYYNKSTPVHED